MQIPCLDPLDGRSRETRMPPQRRDGRGDRGPGGRVERDRDEQSHR